MSADIEVALTTKEFPSINELEIFESFIGKHIEGSLDSGSRFGALWKVSPITCFSFVAREDRLSLSSGARFPGCRRRSK
jgi:hypothetical protein